MKYLNLVIGAIFFLLFSLSIYLINFNSLSDKPENWGHFGSYMSGIISLLNLILFGFLTYSFNLNQQKNDAENKKFVEVLERPTLSFKFDFKEKYWYLENLGKGAALNVVLLSLPVKNKPVIIYSLPSGASFRIYWTKEVAEFNVVYQDVFGKDYTTIFKDDKVEITIDDKQKLRKKENIRLNQVIIDEDCKGKLSYA